MTDDLAQHYRQIISALGENPDREGLRDTPKRAAKAMQFLNAGYHQSLAPFTACYRQMPYRRSAEWQGAGPFQICSYRRYVCTSNANPREFNA